MYYDKTPPVTGINFKTPQFFNRDTLFVNKNTEIGFFSRDTESGVEKTEYKVDNGEFTAYSNKFTVEQEGFHTIEFKSTDKVNNVEMIKKSQLLFLFVICYYCMVYRKNILYPLPIINLAI